MDALYQKFYKTFTLSTQKFDKWYHFQKQDVLDQRTTHRKKLNELTEKIALVKEQNLQYKENELRLAEAEEKRKKETEYQKAELQKILDENSTLMEKKKKLEEEIKLCRQDFEKRSEALLESKGNYQEQLKKNEPELKIFEDKLAWKIKTIKTDNIKFSFTHINETNWDEEFSFVLDVSEPMYKVADCIPLISDVDKHVEELNQFRDLFTFLKNMRSSFVFFSKTKARVSNF
ncbi:kinetochore-associated Ndc80 complex subunit spc25 [Lobulomyces angularis]|nr:kinetochore-associated Ndc80 complex subunit spc25 [Lobulomyces angularis]